MKHILALCELFNCNINDLVHNDMSDLQLMDEDVQQSVVKFKKEKQVKIQLICRIIEILASIWKYCSLICIPLTILLMLGLPTTLEMIDLADLMIKLDFKAFLTWNQTAQFFALEFIMFDALISIVLSYFVAMLIIKLCKNFYLGSTPFTLKNVDIIKKLSLCLILYIAIGMISSIIFDSLKESQFVFSFDLVSMLFILFLILISNIFEYGYQLQSDTKHQMMGEVDDKEEKIQTKIFDFINKNLKRYLIGIEIACIIILCGFLIFKPDYQSQIPVILKLEELGYQNTKINHLDFIVREDYSTYHLDLECKKDDYQALNVSVVEHKNKENAVNTFEKILVDYKKTSILRNDYTLSEEDVEYINKDNILDYMITLDQNLWKVDKAYMLYDNNTYPHEFYYESNYIFLLKENRYLLLEYYPYIEFNDEQVNILNQLMERSNELFVE